MRPFWSYKAEIWFTSRNIAFPLISESTYLAVDCKVCRKNICFVWHLVNGKVIHIIQSINGMIHTLLFFFFSAGPLGLGRPLSWAGAAGAGIFSFLGSWEWYSLLPKYKFRWFTYHWQVWHATIQWDLDSGIFFYFQSISEKMSIVSSRGKRKCNRNMTSDSKVHVEGIIVDNRLVWKQLVTGLDFHLGIEVFPGNIVAKNKVPSFRITTSQIFGQKEQQVIVYLCSRRCSRGWLSRLFGLF